MRFERAVVRVGLYLMAMFHIAMHANAASFLTPIVRTSRKNPEDLSNSHDPKSSRTSDRWQSAEQPVNDAAARRTSAVHRRTIRTPAKQRKVRIKTASPAYVAPWQLNQDVCPPALCGDALLDGVGAEPVKFSFFEGDIVLDSELQQKMAAAKLAAEVAKKKIPSQKRRNRRAIVKPDERLWKHGVVPFLVDQSLPDDIKELITRTIQLIERKTCITFRGKTDQDKDYITFINQPGCWSYVGKTRGQQFVSLGYGCNHFGTVLHETSHALGFWHEQARVDRDKYVQVITKNLSPSTVSQFGKRSANESSSRGYAYDYLSVMHYGDKYYSINDRRTIKVIGQGRKLKLKIGQRKSLSEIDIAQLRDMYKCNQRDATARACEDDWIHANKSCYKFVGNDKQQFAGIKSKCRLLGSDPLTIDTAAEDKFIKNYLIEHHAQVKSWRTGGKKADDAFVWQNSRGRKVRMRYESWSPGQPGKYTSMILYRFDGTPKRFVWRGAWSGSKSQPDKSVYSYICEKKSKVCPPGWINFDRSCYEFVSWSKLQFHTASRACRDSGAHLLWINSADEDAFVKNHLITKHHSRKRWRTGGINRQGVFVWDNPRGDDPKLKYQAWSPNQPASSLTTMVLDLYQGSPKRFVWKSDRPGSSTQSTNHAAYYICEKPLRDNCFRSRTKNGEDYRGKLDYTEQGITCQHWSSQYPHRHHWLNSTGPDEASSLHGLGNHNYCRNPDGRKKPWCFVPLTKTKRQYCPIDICK